MIFENVWEHWVVEVYEFIAANRVWAPFDNTWKFFQRCQQKFSSVSTGVCWSPNQNSLYSVACREERKRVCISEKNKKYVMIKS